MLSPWETPGACAIYLKLGLHHLVTLPLNDLLSLDREGVGPIGDSHREGVEAVVWRKGRTLQLGSRQRDGGTTGGIEGVADAAFLEWWWNARIEKRGWRTDEYIGALPRRRG
jgi:hypothetical protein